MLPPKVNLLREISPEAAPPPSSKFRLSDAPKRQRRRWRKIVAVFLITLGVLFTANIVIPGIRLSRSFGSKGLFAQLQHLAFGGDREVLGENNDRVNILLLGIGGAGHDGPLLSDTIMIASLQPSTGKAALISIPRDLVIRYANGTSRKINEAYGLGETLNPGHGGEFAASSIGGVMGLEIPYYAIVDFTGFKKIIDEIGGVNINIERGFTDYTFPTADSKITTVSFTAGWQHMTGEQALTFARSRHGNNSEGSDFARAQRQQKMLLATKSQLISAPVLLNPLTVNRLANELANNIKTNLEPWQIWRLYTLGKNINPEHVIRVTPDVSPGGLLVESIAADGAYILSPRNNDFGELRSVIAQVFTSTELIQEPPRLEVQNGTTIPGLAATVAAGLQTRGYRVVAVTNAASPDAKDTVIYDFTGGTKPASLASLRVLFNARLAAGIPAWLLPSASTLDPNAQALKTSSTPASNADFLILVGANSISTFSIPTNSAPGTKTVSSPPTSSVQ